MTANDAVRILSRLQICVDTDACDMDCGMCRYNDDNWETHKAHDMAMDALKIVHCSECDHKMTNNYNGTIYCVNSEGLKGITGKDFCSKGVRR